MYQAIKKFLRDEEGLTTVEYAIAGGLVALVVAVAFTELGTAVSDEIGRITDCVSSNCN